MTNRRTACGHASLMLLGDPRRHRPLACREAAGAAQLYEQADVIVLTDPSMQVAGDYSREDAAHA